LILRSTAGLARRHSPLQYGKQVAHPKVAPVDERGVGGVGAAGDPADVGRAAVHARVRVEIEHCLVGVGALGEVPAGGVPDALGLGTFCPGLAVLPRRPAPPRRGVPVPAGDGTEAAVKIAGLKVEIRQMLTR
jgi:hypothetical protein